MRVNRHGVSYLHLIVVYLLPAATNGIQGYFRGIEIWKITLISSFTTIWVQVLAALPLYSLMEWELRPFLCLWQAGSGMLIAEVPLLVQWTYWKEWMGIDTWSADLNGKIMYDIKQAVREMQPVLSLALGG